LKPTNTSSGADRQLEKSQARAAFELALWPFGHTVRKL
jgi:hypothetical protein